MVAIVGLENLYFDENGIIELSFDDIGEVPDEVMVYCPDHDEVPSTSDDIDCSNPDNLDDPVIDAGIVNVEI